MPFTATPPSSARPPPSPRPKPRFLRAAAGAGCASGCIGPPNVPGQTKLVAATTTNVGISASYSSSVDGSSGSRRVGATRALLERAAGQEEVRTHQRRTRTPSPPKRLSPRNDSEASFTATSTSSSALSASTDGQEGQRGSQSSGFGVPFARSSPVALQESHQNRQPARHSTSEPVENPFLASDEKEENYPDSLHVMQTALSAEAISTSRRTSKAGPLSQYSEPSLSPTKISYVHSSTATAAVTEEDRTQLTDALNNMLRLNVAQHQADRQQRRSNKDPSTRVPKLQTRLVFGVPGGTAPRDSEKYACPASVSEPDGLRPQSLPRSGQPAEVDLGKKLQSRRTAVRELVISEQSFLSDMIVLRDACFLPAKSLVSADCMSERDLKTLFSNLPVLITFSGEFLELLAAAGNVDLITEGASSTASAESVGAETTRTRDDAVPMRDWIGEAFLQLSSQMAELYADYCSRHEAAVTRLQELESGVSSDNRGVVSQYIKDCSERIKGKTNAWDIGSLLIKPVQRVLKYPLLLQAIFKETPDDHPDFESLKFAITEAQKVADHVNEIKKRKDLVEQITGVKKKDVDFVHGINKKWSRAGQQLKLAAGIGGDVGVDPVFEALVERLDIIEYQSRLFTRYVANWLKSLKHSASSLDELASTLENIYALNTTDAALTKGPQRVLNVMEYRKRVGVVMNNLLRRLEAKAKEKVFLPVEEISKMRSGIDAVMGKRAKKLLDYTKSEGMRAKGDTPDKALQESADAYVSIHGQLLDELPKFVGYCIQYLDTLLCQVAALQREFHDGVAAVLTDLARRAGFLGNDESSAPPMSSIAKEYVRRLVEDNVDGMIKSLSVIGWRKHPDGKAVPALSSGEAPLASELQSGVPDARGVVWLDACCFSAKGARLTELDFRTRSSSLTGLDSDCTWPNRDRTPGRERRRPKAEGIPTDNLISFDSDPASPTDPFADPESAHDPFQSSNCSSRAPSSASSRSPMRLANNPETPESAPAAGRRAHEAAPDRFRSRSDAVHARAAATGLSATLVSGRATPPLFSAAVAYAYRPDDPAHLRLEEGDVVNVRRCSPGWWFGEDIETGATGWFPESYCVRME